MSFFENSSSSLVNIHTLDSSAALKGLPWVASTVCFHLAASRVLAHGA